MRPHFEELLDSPRASTVEAARALADLRRMNRWLGGRSVLLSLLEAEVRRARLGTFSMLDVGAASGDLGAAVVERFPRSRVVLCDIKPLHLDGSRLLRVAADGHRPPFPDRSFDFVAASLLLHHFRDEDVTRLLGAFGRVARHAVLVSDLERHWLPLLFIRAATPLFARSPITRHDAPASIRQAFRPGELAALARAAGFRDAAVRRHRPWFRLSLIAHTNGAANA